MWSSLRKNVGKLLCGTRTTAKITDEQTDSFSEIESRPSTKPITKQPVVSNGSSDWETIAKQFSNPSSFQLDTKPAVLYTVKARTEVELCRSMQLSVWSFTSREHKKLQQPLGHGIVFLAMMLDKSFEGIAQVIGRNSNSKDYEIKWLLVMKIGWNETKCITGKNTYTHMKNILNAYAFLMQYFEWTRVGLTGSCQLKPPVTSGEIVEISHCASSANSSLSKKHAQKNAEDFSRESGNFNIMQNADRSGTGPRCTDSLMVECYTPPTVTVDSGIETFIRNQNSGSSKVDSHHSRSLHMSVTDEQRCSSHHDNSKTTSDWQMKHKTIQQKEADESSQFIGPINVSHCGQEDIQRHTGPGMTSKTVCITENNHRQKVEPRKNDQPQQVLAKEFHRQRQADISHRQEMDNKRRRQESIKRERLDKSTEEKRKLEDNGHGKLKIHERPPNVKTSQTHQHKFIDPTCEEITAEEVKLEHVSEMYNQPSPKQFIQNRYQSEEDSEQKPSDAKRLKIEEEQLRDEDRSELRQDQQGSQEVKKKLRDGVDYEKEAQRDVPGKQMNKKQKHNRRQAKNKSKQGDFTQERLKNENIPGPLQKNTLNAGLVNSGNTCYMNSVLQCLCKTPWRNLEYNLYAHDPLLKQFFSLMKKMSSTSGALNTNGLKSAISQFSERFATRNQQDAHEFLTFLLDKLSEQVQSLSEEGDKTHCPIEDNFIGKLHNGAKFGCDHKITTTQTFFTVSLPVEISPPLSVENCLSAFLQEEEMEDEAYCNPCRKLVGCTLKLSFEKLPRIMVLHLKKFDFFRLVKLDINVTFPFKGLQVSDSSNTLFEYDLFGICNHYGSLSGGHYTADVKSFDSDDWYNYNDSRVEPTTKERLMSNSSNTYLLFYQQVSE